MSDEARGRRGRKSRKFQYRIDRPRRPVGQCTYMYIRIAATAQRVRIGTSERERERELVFRAKETDEKERKTLLFFSFWLLALSFASLFRSSLRLMSDICRLCLLCCPNERRKKTERERERKEGRKSAGKGPASLPSLFPRISHYFFFPHFFSRFPLR